MSRVKTSKTYRSENEMKHREWPVVVYLWILALAISSYAVARIALDGKPHPYHWLAGLLGGLAGIPLGWLWYRWRGDVF